MSLIEIEKKEDYIDKWEKKKIINNEYYKIKISKRKNKKYDVYKKDSSNEYKYLLSFGDKRYQQYKDKFKQYEHLNHGNKDRLYKYYARHGTEDNPESSKYWSNLYLW
jgi:hypothetical protein